MTAKRYRTTVMGIMLAFIACGFILGMFFPAIPGWAYLAVSLAFGVILFLFISPKLMRNVQEAMTDERMDELTGKSLALVSRFVTPALILYACVAMQFRKSNFPLFISGFTVWCVWFVQYFSFIIVRGAMKRKSE